ncbi:hypothetical protein DMJ13_17930 [halophilic archaeon]|nr:hypothetical protein DMJ13_17930 [halophilic archaeon]
MSMTAHRSVLTVTDTHVSETADDDIVTFNMAVYKVGQFGLCWTTKRGAVSSCPRPNRPLADRADIGTSPRELVETG